MGKQVEDKFMEDTFKFMKAEAEAFEKAGIAYGTVTFTCPLCGGKATATKFKSGSRTGGGSSCENNCIRSII
jgi:hypothetical protein